MRRFLTLVCLLGLAIPAGVSITGCTRNPAGNYCNGLGYGLKNTDVANITMQPQIAGISLAFGQTTQAQTPDGYHLQGRALPRSVRRRSATAQPTTSWSTSRPLADICAGTWNRNTGGGIAGLHLLQQPESAAINQGPALRRLPTLRRQPLQLPRTRLTVYVHPPISSISLVTTPVSGTSTSGCYSQNQQAHLDADAYYSLNGVQTLLCAPGSSSLPACSNSIGTLSFIVGTESVATINAATNVITAQQPGTTAITANIAQSSSSAGYFSTCPPASIKVALANGNTQGRGDPGRPAESDHHRHSTRKGIQSAASPSLTNPRTRLTSPRVAPVRSRLLFPEPLA